MYNARVFNVMIASPSDVESERSIIREVIYDWNVVHSVKERIVLLPVDWESHSSPEMGERPQAIINKQTVDKCDLLVAVFGTRIGTETGEYPSGTVEEIEKHMALGKPVMLYFSTQLGHSDDFDEEQYTKLKELKKDYENRGLYEIYDDHLELGQKFYHQLELKVNEHEIFQFQREGISSGLEMAESDEDITQLSDTAKKLLKEASSPDGDGHVLHPPTHGETLIQINRKNMIPDQDHRVVKQWEAALKELENADLLERKGDKGKIFDVTARGYEIADMIDIST